MASASQSMLNQTLFDNEQDIMMPLSQIGVDFPYHSNVDYLPFKCSQAPPMKTLAPIPPSLAAADSPPIDLYHHSMGTKQTEDFISHYFQVVPQILSSQSSSSWAWGELSDYCISMKRSSGGDHHQHRLGVAAMKMKKIKGRRKVREPRFCFKTMSEVDVLDDGYKWRKYGQKIVKNTQHARSYYRCTQDRCRVKKRVERLTDDPRMVITTYEGRHIHSPSHDEDDLQTAAQVGNFFC